MIWLIGAILAHIAVFIGLKLFAEYVSVEDSRIACEIEDDFNYFLKTGDDAGYKRRMKK